MSHTYIPRWDIVVLLLSSLAFSCTGRDATRIPRTPRELDEMTVQADSLLKRGLADGAKALYEMVVDEDRKRIPAMIGLGRVALAEHDWREAVDAGRRVSELDTSNLSAHYLEAVGYRELGISQFMHVDWKSSQREFEWILARDSAFDDALYQFGLLERYREERDRAIELARAQVLKSPDILSGRVGLFKLYRYFVATEDSSKILGWLRNQPGAVAKYFVGEALRRNGNLAEAESVFTGLPADPEEVPPAVIHLSVARLRYRQGKAFEAEREYWKALDGLRTLLGAALVFEDMKYIISDPELEYYAALTTVDEKRDFFRSCWNFRNPSAALHSNPRLREHLRRTLVAEREYEYYGFRMMFNNPDKYRELRFPKAFALNEEYNDMGEIYLRQGDPTDRLRSINASQDVDPNESWLYEGTADSPRMIFHFQKHNSAGNNWRLNAFPTDPGIIENLQTWDEKYHNLLSTNAFDRIAEDTRIKTEARALVDYALRTDRQTWESKVQAFHFPHAVDYTRATDGRTLLDISYAIPVGPLATVLGDTAQQTPVEIGVSLVDAHARRSTSRIDTVFLTLSHTSAGFYANLARYVVPPDSYAVTMHVRLFAAPVVGTWTQKLTAPDFSGNDLMMSSIQFLMPSSKKGAVVIDGMKVIHSPFHTADRTQPLYVYFQIYNLVPDALGNMSYSADCILLPEGESSLTSGTVIYQRSKTVRDATVAEFYAIDVRSVDVGRYTLVVRVTDKRRVQTITASRTLDIVKQ
jgi:tetratricopeptide (TPR) repeat protein